jgi:ABC-type branched-subunit amino acid transport system substrate-binding protein
MSDFMKDGILPSRTCDEWTDLLALTPEEQLSPADHAAFIQHVQSCAACAAMRVDYRLITAYLRRSLATTPLSSLPTPILAAMQRDAVIPGETQNAPSRVLPPHTGYRHSSRTTWIRMQVGGRHFLPVGVALLAGVLTYIADLALARLPHMTTMTAVVITLAFVEVGVALILLLTSWRGRSDGELKQERFPAHRTPLLRNVGKLWHLASSMSPEGSARPAVSQRLKDQRGRQGRVALLVAVLSLLASLAFSLGFLIVTVEPVQASTPIGVSTGRLVFDLSRPDGDLKLQAAAKLVAGESNEALSLWRQAVRKDSSDGEAHIYLEDQLVLESHHPYITFVVGTILSPDYISGGRDDLQAAYLAQHVYNDQAHTSGKPLLLLLVAVAHSDLTSIDAVARQVVQAAQADPTIKGVMGWPTSASAYTAINVLGPAGIPMLSPTASGDILTGISPYFFRISPTNAYQERAAAYYVQQVLHAQRIVVFVDRSDPYSSSLAQDFTANVEHTSQTIIVQEFYTRGDAKGLSRLVDDALTHHPDLLFFSGYVNDVNTVLKALPACNTTGPDCPLVMGGEALYLQADYLPSPNAARLRFTSFTFPDPSRAWGSQATFLRDYARTFDPGEQYRPDTYGYNLPEAHTMLAYDAMQTLLSASRPFLAEGKTNFSPDDLREALTQITEARPLQGLSWPIAFSRGDNLYGHVDVLARNKDGSTSLVWQS